MKKSLILGILILTLMLSFISAEKISLSNDDPKTDVIIAGKNYTIELVSASDGSATIKVTDSQGKSETKEIAENSEKEVNNIKIEVESADETNLKLSASIEVEASSEKEEDESEDEDSNKIGLTSDNPKTSVTISGESYSIELISASDTSATIKVSQVKEISEGSSKKVGGIDIMVKNAEETNYKLSAELTIGAESFSLTNENPQKTISILDESFTIEVVSASDGSATIKVSQSKEISEDKSKNLGGLKIEVENADETNLKLSASIEVEAASEESEQEQDEQEKQPPKEVTPTGETGPIEIPKEETKPICNGCELDNNCYPFGYRKSGKLCSENKEFVEQSSAGNKCENNFECESNICASGECVSQGLIKKVLNWLKRLFGFD